MSAGTLTLTNKSASVAGSGTSFSTEITAGDFIVVTVGGVAYTLPVKMVNSNTSLTLVSSYTGPTQAGAAWYAVPRAAMNLVTAALVAQSAEALRGLNYDKQNWQSIFTGTGNITVTLPDGSSWTGPAWNSFTSSLNSKADKVSGAVPVNQGGTGSTDAPGARNNLGLGESSTLKFAGMTIESNSYTSIVVRNTSRQSNDVGAQVNLEVSPGSGARPYFTQRYNDGSTTNQILNNLPTSAGVIAVQGTSGLEYKRDITPASLDETLERIASLEMVNFIYKDDAQNRVRFGFIAEQAETVAPQYIKHNLEPDPDVVYEADELDDEGRPLNPVMRDRPSIDNNPIVMDLLGAVQFLYQQVLELKSKQDAGDVQQ